MSITYSYDIFDTIVTRRTANSRGIFAIMQDKLKLLDEDIPKEIKENFCELRIEGERFARHFFCKDGCEEITIFQIYHAISTTGLLDGNLQEKLIRLEYKTELENIIPIPQIVHEILEHMKKNETVILITDTYLDRRIVRKILDIADKRLNDIPLYLSSEIGKTKLSGSLFHYINAERKLSYSKWIHIGDCYESDYLVPQRLGIKSTLLHNRTLVSIESAMVKETENDSSAQLLIGISKNTRILGNLDGEAIVGASLAGLLLGSYIRWILSDALYRGIKTLYFIARDGYILKKLADIFIEHMGYSITTKYLYGSRKAWRMPAQMSENVDILSLLYASTPAFLYNLSLIADIFDISFLELQSFLPKNKITASCKLSRIDVDILFHYLSNKSEFKQYLIIKNKEKKELVLEYLKQEINLKEDQIAFVEVGGTGYTQKCLEKILRKTYDGRVYTYFFQLYSVSEDINCFLNFIPDKLNIQDAIEPLCRAPHGQTLGYIKSNNKVVQLLETVENKSYFEHNYSKYIEGLLDYAKVYMKYYKDIFESPINRKLINKYWNYYTHIQDKKILDFVGDVPFEVVGCEKQNSKYAPKLSKEEIKKIFCSYKKEPIIWHYNGASIEMSMLRMSKKDRKLFEIYKKQTINCKEGNIQSVTKEINMFAKIPDGRYEPGSKIVIYGAGVMGKAFYFDATQNKKYDVVLWVDKQYYRFEKNAYLICSPNELLNTNFDIIVVAVLDEMLKKSIKKDLLQLGILDKKIDWITPEELLEGSCMDG